MIRVPICKLTYSNILRMVMTRIIVPVDFQNHHFFCFKPIFNFFKLFVLLFFEKFYFILYLFCFVRAVDFYLTRIVPDIKWEINEFIWNRMNSFFLNLACLGLIQAQKLNSSEFILRSSRVHNVIGFLLILLTQLSVIKVLEYI